MVCEEAERKYYEDGGDPYRGYLEFTKTVVKAWSEEEVRAAAKGEFHPDFLWAIFERWGSCSPEEALEFVLGMETKHEAEIKLSGTGLEGGPGEAMEAYVGEMMRAAIAGWASVDVEKVWKVVSGKKLGLEKSQVFQHFGYLTPMSIFEQLAKTRPMTLVREIESMENSLWRRSAIKGFVEGGDANLPWGEIVKEVTGLSSLPKSHDHVLHSIREGLMARWLAVEPAAAEQWFKEEAPEGVGWMMSERGYPDGTDLFATTREEDLRAKEVIRRDYSLGRAAAEWFKRDPDPALQWIQSRSGEGAEVLLANFFSLVLESDQNWPQGKKTELMDLAEQLSPDQAKKIKILLGGGQDASDPFWANSLITE